MSLQSSRLYLYSDRYSQCYDTLEQGSCSRVHFSGSRSDYCRMRSRILILESVLLLTQKISLRGLNFKRTEAEFKEFEPRLKFNPGLNYGLFHLKIVLHFLRFKPALNLNRFQADMRRGSNSLNSDTGSTTSMQFSFFSILIESEIHDIIN